jgi:AraC family transcriptional regulator
LHFFSFALEERMVGLRISTYQPNATMAPHFHEECSFCLVINGSYREHIRDQHDVHRSGHMLFYPAGEMHSQEFGGSGSRKIIFTPQRSSLEFLEEHGVSLAHAPAIRSTALAPLGSRILAELRKPDQFAELAVQGLLLETVAVFARQHKSHFRQDAAPSWLREVRERLHKSLASDSSNESIAADIGKHPVHLAREFRRHFGQTIGEYQRQLRLNKAEKLLRTKAMSLTEVALESGFCSHSHLSRSFKSAYGITPSRFRSQQA